MFPDKLSVFLFFYEFNNQIMYRLLSPFYMKNQLLRKFNFDFNQSYSYKRELPAS